MSFEKEYDVPVSSKYARAKLNDIYLAEFSYTVTKYTHNVRWTRPEDRKHVYYGPYQFIGYGAIGAIVFLSGLFFWAIANGQDADESTKAFQIIWNVLCGLVMLVGALMIIAAIVYLIYLEIRKIRYIREFKADPETSECKHPVRAATWLWMYSVSYAYRSPNKAGAFKYDKALYDKFRYWLKWL